MAEYMTQKWSLRILEKHNIDSFGYEFWIEDIETAIEYKQTLSLATMASENKLLTVDEDIFPRMALPVRPEVVLSATSARVVWSVEFGKKMYPIVVEIGRYVPDALDSVEELCRANRMLTRRVAALEEKNELDVHVIESMASDMAILDSKNRRLAAELAAVKACVEKLSAAVWPPKPPSASFRIRHAGD